MHSLYDSIPFYSSVRKPFETIQIQLKINQTLEKITVAMQLKVG